MSGKPESLFNKSSKRPRKSSNYSTIKGKFHKVSLNQRKKTPHTHARVCATLAKDILFQILIKIKNKTEKMQTKIKIYQNMWFLNYTFETQKW